MSSDKEVVMLFFQNMEIFHSSFGKVQEILAKKGNYTLQEKVEVQELFSSIKFLLDVLLQDYFLRNRYLLDKNMYKELKK